MAKSLNVVESLFHYDAKKSFSKGRIHIVNKGDTLSQIARLEYGNGNLWPYIWVNNLNFCASNKVGILSPLLLYPGKEIYLPHLNDVLKWYSKEDTTNLYLVTQLEQIMPLYFTRSSVEQERFPNLFNCAESTKQTMSPYNPAVPEQNIKVSENKNRTTIASFSISLKDHVLDFPKLISTKYLAFGTKVGFSRGKISYKPLADMPSVENLSISVDGKLKPAISEKDLNIQIFSYFIKSIEVSYELSDQLAIELKVNDSTLGISSKSGFYFKQEGEIVKSEVKSDTNKNKVIGGASVKWEYTFAKDSINISLKAGIHTSIFSHVFKKSFKLGNYLFLKDCEYGVCFEDVEGIITCAIKVRDKKVLDALKKLFEYLKKGRPVADKTVLVAKYLLSVILDLWNKLNKDKGDGGSNSGATTSQTNSATAFQKERRRQRSKKAKKEKKSKQTQKKESKSGATTAFSDLVNEDNLEIDFSDDVIKVVPPGESTEQNPILAHLDNEYSPTFTTLLRRMRYMDTAVNWNVVKLRRAINSYEEEQIKNDIIKNRGIPYSFRFLDAFAAHGAANNKEFPERGELFFSLDPKTGLQNLSTYLLIGGLIVVGAVLIVYTLPVTIPVAVATGSAIAAGVGKAAAVGKLAITVTGTYAIAFK